MPGKRLASGPIPAQTTQSPGSPARPPKPLSGRNGSSPFESNHLLFRHRNCGSCPVAVLSLWNLTRNWYRLCAGQPMSRGREPATGSAVCIPQAARNENARVLFPPFGGQGEVNDSKGAQTASGFLSRGRRSEPYRRAALGTGRRSPLPE